MIAVQRLEGLASAEALPLALTLSLPGRFCASDARMLPLRVFTRMCPCVLTLMEPGRQLRVS